MPVRSGTALTVQRTCLGTTGRTRRKGPRYVRDVHCHERNTNEFCSPNPATTKPTTTTHLHLHQPDEQPGERQTETHSIRDRWTADPGGFSILGGKSKQGKSSLARCACVAVSKGLPFLSRETTQGEVILINLEDPLDHVANCLNVLGYDEQTDCTMRVVTDLLPTLQENIAALDHALSTMPDVRLVVIDTLAKFIRVKDLSEYMPVLKAVEQYACLRDGSHMSTFRASLTQRR